MSAQSISKSQLSQWLTGVAVLSLLTLIEIHEIIIVKILECKMAWHWIYKQSRSSVERIMHELMGWWREWWNILYKCINREIQFCGQMESFVLAWFQISAAGKLKACFFMYLYFPGSPTVHVNVPRPTVPVCEVYVFLNAVYAGKAGYAADFTACCI